MSDLDPNPKIVKLCGHDVSVIGDPHLFSDREYYGEWCYRDLSIIINSTSHVAVRQQTLLHEIFEAINEIHELDLEHHQIKTLTAAMFQVLMDNKDLFEKV